MSCVGFRIYAFAGWPMLDWRECRHCGLEFFPKKAFYWYCSWRCYEADHEDRNDGSPGSIWQAAYDSGYRDGRADGLVAGRQQGTMPLPVRRGLVRLVHPDLHQGSALEQVAGDVTRWLLEHRPQEVARG